MTVEHQIVEHVQYLQDYNWKQRIVEALMRELRAALHDHVRQSKPLPMTFGCTAAITHCEEGRYRWLGTTCYQSMREEVYLALLDHLGDLGLNLTYDSSNQTLTVRGVEVKEA